MTKAKLQECIELLNKDGINSKEKVRAILQAELDSEEEATLEQEYYDDIKNHLEEDDLCWFNSKMY